MVLLEVLSSCEEDNEVQEALSKDILPNVAVK